jgi:predicted  nucleic acid-binding Zn-ribbon protein
MYAVVGCGDCSALWVVADEPETTGCPRCGKRHRYGKLKRFVTTADEDHAREVRASMLANRQGEGEAFAEFDSFTEMEGRVEDAGVSDDEYLERSGLDTEEVAAAGDRATEGAGGGTSREETVRAALRELDEPTADEVVAYAAEHGVPEEYVERALSKLARAGEVVESRGTYRLV